MFRCGVVAIDVQTGANRPTVGTSMHRVRSRGTDTMHRCPYDWFTYAHVYWFLPMGIQSNVVTAMVALLAVGGSTGSIHGAKFQASG